MVLKSLVVSPDLRRAWTSGHHERHREIDEDVDSSIVLIGSHEIGMLTTAGTRLLAD